MKYLFWIAGIALIPLVGAMLVFFGLYLSTGEEVPKKRAVVFYRWSAVVMLGTFNIWIFTRVFQGLWALMR